MVISASSATWTLFVLVDVPLPWTYADEVCREEGGHLASIENDDDYGSVESACGEAKCKNCTIDAKGSDGLPIRCWIGGRKPQADLDSGAWSWSDNSSTNYTKFHDTDPHLVGKPTRPFLAIYNINSNHPEAWTGKWTFEPDSPEYPYICEFEFPDDVIVTTTASGASGGTNEATTSASGASGPNILTTTAVSGAGTPAASVPVTAPAQLSAETTQTVPPVANHLTTQSAPPVASQTGPILATTQGGASTVTTAAPGAGAVLTTHTMPSATTGAVGTAGTKASTDTTAQERPTSGVEHKVSGGFQMTVTDLQAFVDDGNNSAMVAGVLADMAEVPASRVTVSFPAVRRLALPRLRQLGSNCSFNCSVQADYMISVPAGSPSSGLGSAANAHARLANMTQLDLATALNDAIARINPGAYMVIIVDNIIPPTIQQIPAVCCTPGNPTAPPASLTTKKLSAEEDIIKDDFTGFAVGGMFAILALVAMCGLLLYHGKKCMAQRSSRDVAVSPASAVSPNQQEQNDKMSEEFPGEDVGMRL